MAKRSGKFYRKNEAEVMKQLGLDPQPGSGSGWILKEDGENEHVMAQLKSTDASSIKINKLDIDILEYNAGVSHKIPLFVINFLQSDEVFLIMKPEDLPSIAEYIETGSCDIKDNDQIAIKQSVPVTRKRIGSGNKDAYWKKEQKAQDERNKKYKMKRSN